MNPVTISSDYQSYFFIRTSSQHHYEDDELTLGSPKISNDDIMVFTGQLIGGQFKSTFSNGPLAGNWNGYIAYGLYYLSDADYEDGIACNVWINSLIFP